jgi:hypothetical protein
MLQHKLSCSEALETVQWRIIDGERKFRAHCPNCGAFQPISRKFAEAHFKYNPQLNKTLCQNKP